MSYKARLALHHQNPHQPDHIDLFIDPGLDKALLTYEINYDLLDYIAQKDYRYGFIIQLRADSNPVSHTDKYFRAIQKSDHRRKYMSFSGQIPDKGAIQTISTGVIQSLPTQPEIFFSVLQNLVWKIKL